MNPTTLEQLNTAYEKAQSNFASDFSTFETMDTSADQKPDATYDRRPISPVDSWMSLGQSWIPAS